MNSTLTAPPITAFAASQARYDLILDMGGSRSLSDLRRVLRPAGTLVLVSADGGNRLLGGMGRWIQALVMSPFLSHTLRPLSSSPNEADLQLLKEMIEAGKVTPVVDRTYPLSQVADAIRYVREGRPRGKIVINVRP